MVSSHEMEKGANHLRQQVLRHLAETVEKGKKKTQDGRVIADLHMMLNEYCREEKPNIIRAPAWTPRVAARTALESSSLLTARYMD